MYLIFDTETTGLPQNYKAPITDTQNWTRLVQLAWIEYDINGNELRRSNLIIKPEGFIIPQDSIDIHRVTNEIANEKGISLADAVEQFDQALLRNHYLIAHNISFDQKIMGAEYVRLDKDYKNLYAIEHIDTKDTTVQFCKIPSRGKGFNFKWPTLTELHETLFGRGFDGAHDAMVDVLALAKCFFKLQELEYYDYKDIPQKIAGLDFVPKEGATYDYGGSLSDAELDKPVVALGVHTDHSLLRGAATAKDYIEVAKKNNHPAIGITDWNTMSGTLEFWMKCKEAKIHPVLGMELMINENIGKFEEQGDEGGDFPLKFFIKNQEGYVNMNKLLYKANTEGFRYPYGRIKTEWLLQNKEGIIVTAGCHDGFICDLMQKGHKREAEAYFKLLHTQFGEDFYVEIKLNELIVQKRLNNFLLNLASKYGVKVFTDNDVHYAYPEDNDLQDTLLAIGQKAPRSQARLFERRSLYYPTRRDYLKLNRKYGYNYPEDVLMSFMDNTLELGGKCRFDFEIGKEKYPRYEATPEIIDFFGTDDPEKIIYKLSFGKLNKKLKERAIRTKTPISKEQVQEYHDRLNFELEVIKSKSMLDYFLVNWELIRYYRSTGHEIGAARGSGGGSLLSYALDITKIDPLKYGLYFERFLNPTRDSPPDLDIDFESDTQDIIDGFLVKKYGATRTFHVCTLGTFNEKSCLKDVGRALLGRKSVERGSDIEQVNRDIDRQINHLGDKFQLKEFFESYSKSDSCHAITKNWLNDPENKKVMVQTLRLQGRVKQLGQHAAGVVITPTDSWNYIPTNVIAENGAVVSAFPEADGSFKALSYLGILKLDTLKISAMNIISSCIKMVKERRNIDITDDIVYVEDHFDDPKLYEEIRLGLNHGIFQFESSGMNGLIRSIHIENFEELTAANALFRPGPMGIGADKEFIVNKFNPEAITYVHPLLEEVLKETNGVMVFQEQVQFLAKKIAGFNYGKGDMLRRYMDKGAKFIAKVNLGGEIDDNDRSDRKFGDYLKFQGYWSQFMENAKAAGVDEHSLQLIQEYMLKYLGYSFNKSHSVGYAYIAMQTLYLKTYYPEEFYCSLLNNPKTSGSLDKQKEWLTKTIASAMAKGVRVVAPSRKSEWDCAITDDKEITLGFSMVKGFGDKAYLELTELLQLNKKTLEDISMASFFSLPFSNFNKTAFNACLKSGVFDEWSSSREFLLSLKTKKKKKTDPNQLLAFDIDTIQYGSKIDTIKFPPTQDIQKRLDFEEACGFDLTFINRVAKINEAIIKKSQESESHVDPITSFDESGDYYFFLHDIRYLETKRKTEYLEMKVGDGITTTKIRAFGDLAKRLKPELQKNAVYLSQFTKNDKGFINFKKTAKFKMIVEPSGDKLLSTT